MASAIGCLTYVEGAGLTGSTFLLSFTTGAGAGAGADYAGFSSLFFN